MKYIELFAGIGGMGHGLMQAGMECVGYCEIDKYAHQAFQILHDPEERMWNAYDVRSVTDDDLRSLGRERGPIQLIAGGFPCQSFSVAGKRQGFKDRTRGTLFFEIVRFASILRPQYLLLENVTGLLGHDDGRTFETIIRTMDELGYVGEWCVLNSSTYLPQSRERIFIVASLGGISGPKIFPFGEKSISPGIRIVGTVKAREDAIGQRDIVHDPAGIIGALTATDYKQPKLIMQEDGRIRRLTPLEGFRLQGFPDEWYYKLKKSGISDSQLYKMAGNAVTSRVAYEIGARIMNLPKAIDSTASPSEAEAEQ